ncbi:helix-loop-helix protein delilah-like [Macrobrachium nipponense]|uniref:helix-loop-helix protein delilah-like n=1 Tax=Macrobrachium nipponense TaxID=159736 RepID=UPI0030C8C073
MSDPKNTMDNAVTNLCDQNGEKYALRPRSNIKRQKQEQYQPDFIPKRPRRLKPKSTPLSKYRRKTANARERHRMKVINTAFESLRKVLPAGMDLCATSSTMTKITTLRLAVSYIRSLSNMLESDASGTDASKKPPDGVQFQAEQQERGPSSVDTSSTYTLPQTVAQVTNKNILRCPRPPTVQYGQPSGYYFSSSHSHMSNVSAKSYAFSPSSSSSVRGSLSSTSDLEELLSDDSEFLEDNFDVFHDIQNMASNDPFEVLLEAEKSCQGFANT